MRQVPTATGFEGSGVWGFISRNQVSGLRVKGPKASNPLVFIYHVGVQTCLGFRV